MTGPSRTDELIGTMLEQRSGSAAPAWLADRTMHAVATTRQARGRGRRGVALLQRPGMRIAAVGALVLALLLLTGAALLPERLRDSPGAPAPSAAAVVAGSPDGSPSAPPTPGGQPLAGSSAIPSLAPLPTVKPVAQLLEADTIAAVTKDGRRLRVRSAPGLGADSELLEPLLPAGARMLVVSGPVAADGYDWYEVLVDPEDGGLYGWVAEGKDGKAWIRPQAPRCPESMDGGQMVQMNRLDYLVCFGDAQIEMYAFRVVAAQGDDALCMSTGIDACTVRPEWMNAPVWLELQSGDGGGFGFMTTANPEVWARAAAIPDGTPAIVTLAADDPAARDCRFTDLHGADLVEPARAALACRMQFTLVDVRADEVPSSSGADAPIDSDGDQPATSEPTSS